MAKNDDGLEPRHTAGPWFAGVLDEEGGTISVGPYDLAEAYGGREDYSPARFNDHYESAICHVYHGNEDGIANAAVIRAAPELFDALRAVLPELTTYAGLTQLPAVILLRRDVESLLKRIVDEERG